MRSALVVALFVGSTPLVTYADRDGENIAEEYASRGTHEVGGSIGASISDHVTTITASPTLGTFIADRVQLSTTFTYAYMRTVDDDTDMESASTTLALLFATSYHQPLTNDVLVPFALAVGFGHAGSNFDFRVVPSIGLEILTSRRSIIRPAVGIPILVGRTHSDSGDIGTDVGLGLDVGVTTTW